MTKHRHLTDQEMRDFEIQAIRQAYQDEPRKQEVAHNLRLEAETFIDSLELGYFAFDGNAKGQAHFFKALKDLEAYLDASLERCRTNDWQPPLRAEGH